MDRRHVQLCRYFNIEKKDRSANLTDIISNPTYSVHPVPKKVEMKTEMKAEMKAETIIEMKAETKTEIDIKIGVTRRREANESKNIGDQDKNAFKGDSRRLEEK